MHSLVSFAQPFYRRLSRRNHIAWNLSKAQLLSFPVSSLGQELGCFLDKHNFSLMAQFETHDVFHILLEYKPTALDEARMQYCLVGSGKKSLFSLGTCLISILLYPEFAIDFKRHYQRGKKLKNFSHWDFKALLNFDINQLRTATTQRIIIS